MVALGELNDGIVPMELTNTVKTKSLTIIPRFLFSWYQHAKIFVLKDATRLPDAQVAYVNHCDSTIL